MVLIPTVKWAQRPHVVYLTIDVQDAKDPKINLTNTEDGANGRLVFSSPSASGADEDAAYTLDLALFAAVDVDASKISTTPRSVFLVLEKKEPATWPRLTKESGKHLTHIKVDWDKWVDSDDEGDDQFDPSAMGDLSSLGGMGGGGMGGMMGGGGMGGMDLASMMGGMGGGGGGMGGMGGMDLASMMGGMGGMGGGMGGMDGMDFAAAGAGAGAGGEGAEGAADEGDSDDEELPELKDD